MKRRTDARDDYGRTDEDTPLQLNLLGNDIGAVALCKINGRVVEKGDVVELASGARLTVGADGQVTYDPSGSDRFDFLDDGETARDSFTYTALGRHGSDSATVRLTIDGVTDAPDPGNSPPVAVNDLVLVPGHPYPNPYPVPLPYEIAAETGAASDLTGDGPIFTTLAIGEEGDPDPLPKSVGIAPLANDSDPDGDALTVGQIAGADVSAGDTVTLKSGAEVTVSADGRTLTYTGGVLTGAPLPLELADGPYATGDVGQLEAVLLPTPLPKPIPYPYRVDVFTYRAFDGEDYSDEAHVTVAQTDIYYYDVPFA